MSPKYSYSIVALYSMSSLIDHQGYTVFVSVIVLGIEYTIFLYSSTLVCFVIISSVKIAAIHHNKINWIIPPKTTINEVILYLLDLSVWNASTSPPPNYYKWH